MGPNALKFFHSLARKGLTKNRGSGITEIADRMAVESEAASMIQTIVDSGLPLERFDQFIRSEADVLKFLNIIKNAKPVSTSETTSGVVLPFKQKRSFAEEIEAMKKSGDIVDKDNMIISDKITEREMFKNSNLNKPTIEGQMEKINAASNRIKQIQKEQDEMYRPKTDAEIAAKYDKENKESIQRFKDKMKKDEPEDKADGGRIGYQEGGGIESRLEQLGGDVTSAEQMLQQINERLESAGSSIPEGGGDPNSNAGIFNPNGTLANIANYTPQFPAGGLGSLAGPNVGNEIAVPSISGTPTFTPLPEDKGGGILSGPAGNQNPFDQMSAAEKVKQVQMRMMQQDIKPPEVNDYFNEVIKTQGKTDRLYPNLPNMNKLLPISRGGPGPDQMQSALSQQNLQKALPGLFAKGGRAGFYTGGITDVEPRLDDIGHGSDSLMSRTRLMSPGAQATTSTGLNYLLAEDNDNLRVPFSAGGDPRRRAFLKLLATLTGGAAAFKTGILGLGEGTAKKAVTETVKQSAGNYPPPYFFKLVEKIKFMGDDITEKAATKDREIVKRYKDFEMTEDVATGDIVIKKRNEGSFYDQDGIVSDEYIVYKPGMADETTKGRKPPPEYEEYTVRPDAEGKLRDSEGGLDSIDEILEEVGDVDSMTLKKADGGRIGYNIGGLSKLGITGSSRRFLEKVFGKEKFKNMIENDPELHRGMLEVVEMFRAKDKTGLVEYMQNFLPQMSKKEIEDFIVGSGDISGIEGQLIRLGSGRDYKGKLDMIEEANNVRKLEDFDIDGVSKNAEGGRIGFSGGGIFRAIIANSAKKAGMTPYQYIKATSYKSLPQEVKMFMSKADFEKLKLGQEKMYSNYIDMAKTRQEFQKNIEGGKNTPARELFEGMEKTMDEQSFVPKTVTSDDIAEMELMVKNRFNKGRKDNAEGGLQTMLGE